MNTMPLKNSEFLDILDKSGNSLGRIKQRKSVHWDGDWHRTVHLWIENGKGDALIQKRAHGKRTWPDKWDVSCAGHVSAGQSPRQAVIREAEEELGLRISPLELRHIGTVRESFSDGNKHDNEIMDIFVVQRNVTPDDCTLEKGEVSEVRLISVKEFINAVKNGDPDFVPHKNAYPVFFDYLAKTAKHGI